MQHIRSFCVLVLTLLCGGTLIAAEFRLTAETRIEVITRAIEQLETGYILPDRGRVAAAELAHRLETGYFDEVVSPQTFANRITGVLDVISDWHLWVNYHDEPIPEDFHSWQFADEAAELAHLRRRNFGFERVERLAGNVGYIELRDFFYQDGASERALASVMDLVRHTDGLIIDLRRNGGGSPEMVNLFASYFLPAQTHIGDIRYKEGGRVVSSYTPNEVSGAHYGADRPVYILLSENTFSGAEGFSYALQAQERATLVGERTRGGAHLFADVRLHEHFMMALPIARSVNPITQSSWQYVGVRPEIDVPAEGALRAARKAMLERLIAEGSDATAISEQAYALDTLSD